MEIPIRFKLFLFWKSIFKEESLMPKIKISKKGTGVRSILFFLPEKREHAKIINYLVKVDSSLSGYTIGYVCNEQSKSFYSNSDNLKFITYNDDDLNYFGTIKSVAFLNQLKSIKYEALVDLNTTFCAATSMLAFELDIPLKIGFNSLIANKTYTITLDRKDDTFLENSFNLIQRLLGLNF
tara:strand:+ start:800 stop:1342 length:543 start_codon:yes stop_codon:yes gene_type:complete